MGVPILGEGGRGGVCLLGNFSHVIPFLFLKAFLNDPRVLAQQIGQKIYLKGEKWCLSPANWKIGVKISNLTKEGDARS